MEVQKLTPDDMQQVRSVWKECFQDSNAFLDTYFETVVDIMNGIGFFENGQLVSDLFQTPMNAQISGMVYESLFLSGCATLPPARNQHLMRDLIRTALADMRARNVCVSFLHPFLHSFYRKFGYETVNYVSERTAASDTGAAAAVQHVSTMDAMPVDAVYASYNAYVSQYGNYFMRSKERMKGWLKLLFDDGGGAVFIDGQNDTPYALFYPGTDENGQPQNEIFELVYFSDEQLQTLTQGTGAPSAFNVPTTSDDPKAAEFTMMRIVCPEIMLESYSYVPGTKPFVINIHDPFLSRDYSLRVVPKVSESAEVTEVAAESDIVVGINDLAKLFTGTYSALDYPGAVSIFPTGSSCFFDTY